MKYSLTDGNLHELRTPCVVLSLKQATRLARDIGAKTEFARATTDFSDKLEQNIVVHLGGTIPRLLVIGGADDQVTPDNFRRAVRNMAAALLKLPIKQAVIALEKSPVKGKRTDWKLRTIMQGISHAGYRYNQHLRRHRQLGHRGTSKQSLHPE